jgi:hypothetical protein
MNDIKKVMLVAPDDVKTAYVNYNVDDSLVGASIRETQDIHLQSIIGSNLLYRLQELVYNAIEEESDNIEESGNTLYRELLDDYVNPYMVSKAQAVLCVPLSYKLRNLGVTKTNDENIQQTSLKEVMAMQRRFNTSSAFYATHLSKYLCLHKDDFEELKQTECSCGMFVPAVLGKTFVETGLVLGSTKNGCNC